MARPGMMALAGIALLALLSEPWEAVAGSIQAGEWNSYREKFLDASGRIVDTANNNISHSEGQGYGLLLSYLADNRGDFDNIWAFTRTEMLLRDDGLAVWKWDPASTPHVTDANNATDGDLLIAYAAALAGRDWQRPDLTAAAATMAASLAEGGVERIGGAVLLKPGNTGFGPGERLDGPVVNPSYWVFEALPVMAAINPDGPWTQLASGGNALVASSMKIGPSKLPPDWVSVKSKPTPADGFPREFGYNALRIPLYLLRAGVRDRALLQPFLENMADAEGRVRVVDIATGETRKTLDEAGYRVIPALIGCVLDNKPLPIELQTFTPADYYPSTLHLLALSFARRRHPECL